VLKPGGTLIMVGVIDPPMRQLALTPDEQAPSRYYRVYCLPYVISLPEYEAIAHNLSLQNIRTADWSTAVAPFGMW